MGSKHKELSESERNQIVGAWKCGSSATAISRNLGFALTTVKKIIKHYKNSGELKPSPRVGRPLILDDRDTRHLLRVLKKDRKTILNVLQDEFAQSTYSSTIPS